MDSDDDECQRRMLRRIRRKSACSKKAKLDHGGAVVREPPLEPAAAGPADPTAGVPYQSPPVVTGGEMFASMVMGGSFPASNGGKASQFLAWKMKQIRELAQLEQGERTLRANEPAMVGDGSACPYSQFGTAVPNVFSGSAAAGPSSGL